MCTCTADAGSRKKGALSWIGGKGLEVAHLTRPFNICVSHHSCRIDDARLSESVKAMAL